MKRTGKLVVYLDRKGGHRWRTVSGNGRITGDSGESYKTRSGCLKGALSTLRTLQAGLGAA